MNDPVLLVEQEQAVLKLTVNRPAKLNALNSQVMAELADAMNRAASDRTVRVVTLTGAGDKAFIAGADIGELRELSPESARANVRVADELMHLMEHMGKPVIAAINGYALGGGCELALACTLRVASSNAKIGLPEIKLGLIPGYGGTQRLARLAGRGRALEMMLTGTPIDAQKALDWGIVTAVTEPEALGEYAGTLATGLASAAPLSVKAIMDAVRLGSDLPLDDGLEIEKQQFSALFGTGDMLEGTAAFLEKRKPDFRGR